MDVSLNVKDATTASQGADKLTIFSTNAIKGAGLQLLDEDDELGPVEIGDVSAKSFPFREKEAKVKQILQRAIDARDKFVKVWGEGDELDEEEDEDGAKRAAQMGAIIGRLEKALLLADDLPG